MRFEVTSDDHIVTITEDVPDEAEQQSGGFTTEQELHRIGAAWPMKRLIAIWNNLPGIRPVEKFENRTIALARIWQAIRPEAEQSGETVARPTHARSSRRVTFREGSKAAEVFTLLGRPEGATLDEIRSATAWQAHTVRGFISRTLRKQGLKVRSFRKDGQRVYRLEALRT
jgi:Protein of unknown function (DUF3489)